MRMIRLAPVFVMCSLLAAVGVARAQETSAFEYRVLATSKTSTMEKELNEAAEAGFRFVAIMGGETAMGGKETVTVMGRHAGQPSRVLYKLLATSKTSTMQKELQEAGDAGYETLGVVVGKTTLGGRELVVITRKRVK